MTNPMLKIKGLEASIDTTPILKGLNLEIKPGEIHAVMGPNGSGKSTLSKVLAGHPAYEVTGGDVSYCGEDLLAMEPDDRAKKGMFLAFQYPQEVPGVSIMNFMRTAWMARFGKEISVLEFRKLLYAKMDLLGMDHAFATRFVNDGFSGGEKKRNEILQMAILEPKLAILDETDSGLDIDALRVVSNGVNTYLANWTPTPSEHNGVVSSKDKPAVSDKPAVLMITHYNRLLDYIKPDFVHVLAGGRIVKSGGPELALELEAKGYEWVDSQAA